MAHSKRALFTLFLLMSFSVVTKAQLKSVAADPKSNYIGQFNPITTAVPFLGISPDARGGSMGDAGVASEPDAFSMHYNPAKFAFIKKDMGVGISYSPWLKGLTNDINLAYVSGFKRIKKDQVIAMSLRYFNLGDINFTDINGSPIGDYKPNEFALDGTYSRMLTSNLSMAVAARFIHSNLTQGQDVGGQATKPGNSVAADVALFQRFPVEFDKIEGDFSWGLNISNIGTKMSYSDDNTNKDFIPTNLKVGPSLKLNLDDFNQMSFMVDFNKLLVPTQSVDSNGVIIAGMDPNVSVPVGMIHSFYDAPGGFSEELAEISISAGIEYWYAQQFALRGGFFYEDKNKGDRKFFTLGAGFRYNILGIDFSYLIPVQTNGSSQTSPLAHTLRFALLINFDAPSAAK
ncbi:MAG: type IX secretion system outer membrane channel protein PorV [Bacteroidales bacterium]